MILNRVGTFCALFATWLLLSGMPEPFLVAAGFGSALAVVGFVVRLDSTDPQRERSRPRIGALVAYLPWLALEIVRSAWQVTMIIVDPRLPISPTLKTFAPSQSTELGLAVHANSITLTPGTITVRVTRRRMLVHALTRAGADATGAGTSMDRRVAALERR